VSFSVLGPTLVKATNKMLMKLTPGEGSRPSDHDGRPDGGDSSRRPPRSARTSDEPMIPTFDRGRQCILKCDT